MQKKKMFGSSHLVQQMGLFDTSDKPVACFFLVLIIEYESCQFVLTAVAAIDQTWLLTSEPLPEQEWYRSCLPPSRIRLPTEIAFDSGIESLPEVVVLSECQK
jgi:hypothetical protein